VLIDAYVVRMTLVPAVLSLLGDRAWWFPNWLDRLTPKVDIKGESLRFPTDHKPEEKELVNID
jgi:putative drug exporter of the RND superfamily